MRRAFLLLLVIFLASGTVASSIAHATEDNDEKSLLVMAAEAGCFAAPVSDATESERQSPSEDQKQTPAVPHGCHGHHSQVPVETPAISNEVPCSQSHVSVMAAALPPATHIGTFRPPIA